MLIPGELFIAFHFLEPFATMVLASEDLLRFLDCVQLSVAFAAHLENLTKTALAKLVDGIEALLKVRIVLVLVIEAAKKRVD